MMVVNSERSLQKGQIIWKKVHSTQGLFRMQDAYISSITSTFLLVFLFVFFLFFSYCFLCYLFHLSLSKICGTLMSYYGIIAILSFPHSVMGGGFVIFLCLYAQNIERCRLLNLGRFSGMKIRLL